MTAMAVIGFGATACSSDDDNPTEVNARVGVWEADKLTYTFGDQTNTHDYDHPMFKQGCVTDYLTLDENKSASLKENNKNESDVCVDEIKTGMWNQNSVTLQGEEQAREILSVSANEMTLKYPLNFMGQTLEVIVTYKKI